MNAIQPSKPPVQPREKHQVAPRPKSSQRRHNRHPYRGIVLENTAKLLASTSISALALYGLLQLLPQAWFQQRNYQEISHELQQIEGRVNNLRQNFERNFDPRQTNTVMKEQTSLLEPDQRPVLWQHKSTK